MLGNYESQKVTMQVGTKFEAILGWGFISQFYTLIDYKNLSMQFSESPLKLGKNELKINYAVVNNAPVVNGTVDKQEVTLLFDTGAPMCNLDISITSTPKNEKVLKDLQIAGNRIPLEWRVKDLSAIKKSLGTVAVIGNNFLKNYSVYFDTKNEAIYLY